MARRRLKDRRLSMVLETTLREKVEAYRDRHNLQSLSEAARRLMWQALREPTE